MSWWQDAAKQLSSGVESIKQGAKEIANELAEVEEDEDGEEEELQYDSTNNETIRFQQMYKELETAYNQQQQELNQLRSVHEMNQNSSNQQINILENKIKRLANTSNASDASNENMEEQLRKSREELHEFKKKTKLKWDEVKNKFQAQRQSIKNLENLEKENKDLKMKLETNGDNELIQELRDKLQENENTHNRHINALKLESENAANALNIKCVATEAKLTESNNKCIGFEQDIERNKNRHKQMMEQCKILIQEKEMEIESLKNNKFEQLSIDEQTQQIITDLNAKNISSQNVINSMKAQFDEFKNTVYGQLKGEIRPSVALLDGKYTELQSKYEALACKYRQILIENEENTNRSNAMRDEYESEINDLRAKCNNNDTFNDFETNNERLKDTNNKLQQEINSLEMQMKESMNLYKNMLEQKENENIDLCRNLYTVLHKNGFLKPAENDDNDTDIMNGKYLLLSLTNWIESEKEKTINLLSQYKQQINDVNNGNQLKHNKFMHELENNENLISSIRESNRALTDKYKKLEAEWISVCNELDEITNIKNELETECDELREEIDSHQNVLEETRISTQEMIDLEQEQNDKLQQEMRQISDDNKILLAQKTDLTAQLHKKLKNDLILDSDFFNFETENEKLKMSINSIKEIHKKRLHEKDEDIIELNSLINELKIENEELKSLQNDYMQTLKKYHKVSQEYESKKTAFNNLQIAFDALQVQLNKLKALQNHAKDIPAINQQQINTNEELDEMRVKYEFATKQFQQLRSKFTQSQKYQIRLESETANLRAKFAKTAVKLKNLSCSNEQIDRRIIIKLLITFFERWYEGGDTREVIALISKILRFDDGERRKCRIGTNTHNNTNSLWGYARSWLQSDNNDTLDTDTETSEASEASTEDRQKDLGSLWVEFLLNELGDGDEEYIDDNVIDEEEEEKEKQENSNDNIKTQKQTDITDSSVS